MAFERPSLPELMERIDQDIVARLPNVNPALRVRLTRAIAEGMAGAVHGLYGYHDYLARQIIPDTADDEWLERWADIWGVSRERAARASGDVVFSGSDGAAVPEGILLQGDNGEEYETTESGEIQDGSVTLSVEAVEEGTDSNLDAGEELSLVSPLDGVSSTAEAGEDGITGGADQEDNSRLRQRLLNRIQRPPHGGARDDYVTWALDAHPDVSRVWVSPKEMGLGTVTVRIMTDDATEDGTPEQGVIDAVEAYIEERRPVGSEVFVVSPIAVAQDFQIDLADDTADDRDRVEEALRDYLGREAEPGKTLSRFQLAGVIYVAIEGRRGDLISPADDVEFASGEIPVMGDITWL